MSPDREPPRITDEAVEALRARVGIPEPHPQPPYYLCPNEDAFRHVAESYGDDNPLWWDGAHAAASRWGAPIAPPALAGGDTLVGEDEVTEVAPEHKELMRGDPLRGVHAFYSASAREWWAPLRPLKPVARRNALVAVLDKPSEFAERAVHEWTGQVFREVDGPRDAQGRLAGHLGDHFFAPLPAAIDGQHWIQHDGAVRMKADPVIRKYGIRLDGLGGVIGDDDVDPCAAQLGRSDVEFPQNRLGGRFFGTLLLLEGVRSGGLRIE